MTQTNNGNEGDAGANVLYAGKFKSVEELEAGYKNSAVVFDENKALKEQLESLTSVPTTYLNPADLDIDANRLTDLQSRAKEAGLTQSQYEKFLRSDKERLERNKASFEANRKELGDETLNLLQDYVTKYYPKELQDNILKTFIGNKEARQAALNHRQQLLSNKLPGMEKTAPVGGYRVTDDDVKKAYVAKEANRGDMKARQHYMNLLSARAEQERLG